MIIYFGGPFGLNLLARLHGSAVFKALTPSLMSSIFYVLLAYFVTLDDDSTRLLDHPYPVGALVASFTFLLVFRANFAYQRYWEAFTSVHQMHSKWLDVGIEMAAFHYQSNRYDNCKPPAFGKHPFVSSVRRDRQRSDQPTLEKMQNMITTMAEAAEESLPSRFGMFKRSRKKQKQEDKNKNANDPSSTRSAGKSINKSKNSQMSFRISTTDKLGKPLTEFQQVAQKRQLTGGVTADTPPMFLEELAHLLSLLSAVALATLRNDLEEAESPLIEFKPGEPWPHVDPDAYSADVRKGWGQAGHLDKTMRYLFGVSRTDASRTLYNAARPFRVIGNVSDEEVEMLQKARGPVAKVALCSLWLQEFISREYLSGSTGAVAPPIVSRLYQYTSDGTIGYNQARKVAYIPFPFPHAQITTLFVIVIMVLIPALVLSYSNNPIFGFFLNFFTVLCFFGLHEVARELEKPFKNVPNDVPLNNFQGQFNEALMTMFYGYNPDFYWKEDTGSSSYPPSDSNPLEALTEEEDVKES